MEAPTPTDTPLPDLALLKSSWQKNGVDSEIYQIGKKPIIGCTACSTCKKPGKTGRCVFDNDMVNTVGQALREADGIILGSPVHFASASGAATSFFDRLFYSTEMSAKRLKFGAAIVSCRRGGNSATFDQLNKYFTISQMPVVSSCYWNGIHGYTAKDVYADEEGVRIMRTLADNMAYLIRCKHQSHIDLPEEQPHVMTNFIR